MPATLNPYALIRRIIVAALTGTLPDEYRDDSVHILTQALGAPDDEVRAMAVIGLGELGASAAPEVVPALTGAIHDGCDQVRRRAVRSLGHLRATDDASIECLLEALSDFDDDVRQAARRALELIEADDPKRPAAVG